MINITTVEEFAVFMTNYSNICLELMKPNTTLNIEYRQLSKGKTIDKCRLIQAELIFKQLKTK
jgi:hypothetical protein